MRTHTTRFVLPEAIRGDVDRPVRSGQYGHTGEYLRELIEERLNSDRRRARRPQRAAHLKKGGARSAELKQARLRPQAEAGGGEAGRHDATERGIELAERLFDAAIAALEATLRDPGTTVLARHRPPGGCRGHFAHRTTSCRTQNADHSLRFPRPPPRCVWVEHLRALRSCLSITLPAAHPFRVVQTHTLLGEPAA